MHHSERAGDAKAVPSDIPALPPMQQWANVHTLGVKGDGSDDTAAIQAAINAHRVLYFPSGTYRISNTLQLKPDSVLIGFNPVTTVFVATDEDKNFTGQGDPVPMVESAKGGAAIMTGLGILTSPTDRRAAGLVWTSTSCADRGVAVHSSRPTCRAPHKCRAQERSTPWPVREHNIPAFG